MRRAKRKKNWLKVNLIPKSSVEIKRSYNRSYYFKVTKPRKALEKILYGSDTNKCYREAFYDFLSDEDYNYHLTLTYKHQLTMHTSNKDARRVLNKMMENNLINRYFLFTENNGINVHNHILIRADMELDRLKYEIRRISKLRDKFSYIYPKAIETVDHRLNSISYILKKMYPSSKANKSQLEIDYWEYQVA